MALKHVQGLLVLPWCTHFHNEAVEEDLLAYGAEVLDLDRRAAAYVAKLPRGAKAAELPIEQAGRFCLVINLKTVKPEYPDRATRDRRRDDRMMLRCMSPLVAPLRHVSHPENVRSPM
ncbi:hypothetical protein [Bradyrhizobium sp. AUGA SZCCT0431]|uniref:hypothetical protein n=1 Tax=Bradyrhizobium sp. AUGA SZCCT0431 TaxID=2807674 RepID=UPI001BA7EB46|nr:hypothetical protein [Bradyrhizobium sp. AUGA SZCCT0431]MBR1144721.1 hypothetical protein [Bradyrhizobium sp. AUGA SZCCT0431]